MGRIRTIKPEFPQSETVGRLSREARLLFLQLFTIADDEGRLRAASKLIATQLYPYDDDAIGLVDIWMAELVKEKMLIVYRADENTYAQVVNWAKHQRVDKKSESKLPPPPRPFLDHSSTILGVLQESSKSPPRLLASHDEVAPGVFASHSDMAPQPFLDHSCTDLGSRILDLGSGKDHGSCVLEDSTRETPQAPEPPDATPTATSTHRRARESQEFFKEDYLPESHRTPDVQSAWHSWLTYVLDRDGRLVPAAVDAWAMDAARREPSVAAERLRESVSRLAPSGPYWTELTGSRAGPTPKVDPMDELRAKLEDAKQYLASKSKEALSAN